MATRSLRLLLAGAVLVTAAGCTLDTGTAVQPDDPGSEVPVQLPDPTITARPSPTATPSPTARPRPQIVPTQGALLGAYVDPDRDARPEGRWLQLSSLELSLGRRLAIDHLYYRFEGAFPTQREKDDLLAGRIPLVSWGRGYAERINAGAHDAMLVERARAIRDLEAPVLIRWAWDMDTEDAGPYGDPDAFVAAWRRIVDRFRLEGATNAVFVWSPSLTGDPARVARFYPGDGYVDWIATSVYDLEGVADPIALIDPFVRRWAERGKPIMLAEVGVAEGTGSAGAKARWLATLRGALQRDLTAVKAVVYWDSVWSPREELRRDLRIASSEMALAAFKALAADPYFDPLVSTRLVGPSASPTLPPLPSLVPLDPAAPAPTTAPSPEPSPSAP